MLHTKDNQRRYFLVLLVMVLALVQAFAQGKGGVKGFDEHIELYREWVLKNRYDRNHPDENLPGAVMNTRLWHNKGKLWLT